MQPRLFTQALFADGSRGDMLVEGGRIHAIGRIEAAPLDAEVIDLGGKLVTPGFVDGHIHLDKSFGRGDWRPHRPATGLDVRERTRIEKAALSTAAPVVERASQLLEQAIARGTLFLRSHVDIDGEVGLANLAAIQSVRETHKDRACIQIVAFPQSGILIEHGASYWLAEAIAAGADCIGGLDPAGVDNDVEGHLDVVFGLAERRGVMVDIHLHDPGELGLFQLDRIAERTQALGLAGRVSVSHAYALGEATPPRLDVTAARLARAGVAIMTNGAGMYPAAPILTLRAHGVTVFSGSDNVRDSWWPYGNADMLERAMLVGYRAGFLTDDELHVAFDMVTLAGARALNLEGYGLRIGARADFVALDSPHVPEAVVSRPVKRSVYKAGRLVAEGLELIAHAA